MFENPMSYVELTKFHLITDDYKSHFCGNIKMRLYALKRSNRTIVLTYLVNMLTTLDNKYSYFRRRSIYNRPETEENIRYHIINIGNMYDINIAYCGADLERVKKESFDNYTYSILALCTLSVVFIYAKNNIVDTYRVLVEFIKSQSTDSSRLMDILDEPFKRLLKFKIGHLIDVDFVNVIKMALELVSCRDYSFEKFLVNVSESELSGETLFKLCDLIYPANTFGLTRIRTIIYICTSDESSFVGSNFNYVLQCYLNGCESSYQRRYY